MIEIKQSLSLKKIQNLYSELREQQKAGLAIDLSLPKTLGGTDFGLLFGLLQFFATWVRHEHSAKLHLPIEAEEIPDYLNEEFAYPCISLAWEKQIVDKNGNSIKQSLKPQSQDYFRRMELLALPNNSAAPVYCFDHDKNKRGHSRVFYGNNQELYSEFILGQNLEPAFRKISLNFPSIFSKNIRPKARDFLAIIHELFSNTHKHAKTSSTGGNLYPNVRGLYLRFHRKPIQSYIQDYAYHPGLSRFFNSEFVLSSNNELYLMEISIVDSGSGLVKKFKKRNDLDIPIEEEVDIIKQCLHVHNSEGERSDTKGLGLNRVLQTLNNKGFLRIKSGRAEVFRDLRHNPHEPIKKPSDILLKDWVTDSETSFTVSPISEGTLISIFYPLDSSNEPASNLSVYRQGDLW